MLIYQRAGRGFHLCCITFVNVFYLDMNTLIVDDNLVARSVLLKLCSQTRDFTSVSDCGSADEALHILLNKPIDLLLLDIEMPGMTGVELVKSLGQKKPLIIFTTSKTEYAAEAFELNVVDYLVKPINTARFLQALEKVREVYDSEKEEVNYTQDEFIFIRDGNVVKQLKLNDLLFAEAMGDYVKLHTQDKFYAVHTTLKSVEQRLPASMFSRVHRSYLVAVNKIESLQEGTLKVGRHNIPLADAYRKPLSIRMNII